MSFLKLRDVNIGSIIQLGADGASDNDKYIVVHKNYNGANSDDVLLLKFWLNDRMKWDVNEITSYSGSDVYKHENNTFYNELPSSIRNKIISANVTTWNGSSRISIRPKVFSLSATEVGVGSNDSDSGSNPREGSTLAFFSSGSLFEKRKAYSSSSNVIQGDGEKQFNDWWLRSSSTSNTKKAFYISSGQRFETAGKAYTARKNYFDLGTDAYYIRPAFLLPGNLRACDDEGYSTNTPWNGTVTTYRVDGNVVPGSPAVSYSKTGNNVGGSSDTIITEWRNITGGSITLRWTAVEGADGYNIACYTGSSDVPTTIFNNGTSLSRNFSYAYDSNYPGEFFTYRYKVIPYATIGRDDYNGDESNEVTLTVKNNKRPGFGPSAALTGVLDGDSVVLSWDAASDVDSDYSGDNLAEHGGTVSYIIYRNVDNEGFEQIAQNVSLTSYRDDVSNLFLTNGQRQITYKIKAVDGLDAWSYELNISRAVILDTREVITTFTAYDNVVSGTVTFHEDESPIELNYSDTVYIYALIAKSTGFASLEELQSFSYDCYVDEKRISGSYDVAYNVNGDANANAPGTLHRIRWMLSRNDIGRILNGSHHVRIVAKKDKLQAVDEYDVDVLNTSVQIITAPVAYSGASQARINIIGNFPAGTEVKIEVSGDANQSSRTWTTVYYDGFASNGFALSGNSGPKNIQGIYKPDVDSGDTDVFDTSGHWAVRVTADRSSGAGGYIESIYGTVGKISYEDIAAYVEGLIGGNA